MAAYYVKSGAGATVFAQSTAYSSGDKIVPKRSDTGTNHLVAKRYVWECTTAGTTAAAEPTWPSSVTADTTTVTSNTAVFTARKPGYSSGSTENWSFATIYLDYVGALAVAGDTVWVSNNHAESVGASSWGGASTAVTAGLQSGVSYICVNDGATPPTAVATTATVTTGAGNAVVGGPNSYVYGVSFTVGSGDTANRTMQVSGYLEACNFTVSTSSTNSYIAISTNGSQWKNCGVKFASASHHVRPYDGTLVWRGGSLLSGGTSPTALLIGATTPILAFVENIDLSNATASVNIASSTFGGANAIFRNIKLPSSWSGSLNSATPTGISFYEMSATDNSGTNYVYRNKTNGGEVFQETTLVRTGGATNGTTAISYKMVTSASAQFPQIRSRTPDIVRWNDTTGSSVTVTAELLHDSATALTDGECWIEVSYYGGSGSPLGSYSSSARGFLASASNLASSSEKWTTTGMTNPNTQKVSVTFTPQLKGFLIARVMLAKESKTIYVDPKLAVT